MGDEPRGRPESRWDEEMQFFAEGFHTAFRKILDGDASVIVWNAIRLLDSEAWLEFCFNAVNGEGDTMKDRCMSAVEEWYGNPAKTLVRFGLEKLTDDDWESINIWLESL